MIFGDYDLVVVVPDKACKYGLRHEGFDHKDLD